MTVIVVILSVLIVTGAALIGIPKWNRPSWVYILGITLMSAGCLGLVICGIINNK